MKYSINKTEKAIYTCIVCNRWNIKNDLGILRETDLSRKDLEEEEHLADTSEEVEDDTNILEEEIYERNNDFPTTTAKIFIPKDKWSAIEPQERLYARTMQYNSTSPGKKNLLNS